MASSTVATLHAPARTASPSRPAFLLGVLSGSRSATPLGVLALHHDRPEAQGAWCGWPVFRSRLGRGLLVAAMLGELVGDKLPMTPSRTTPGALSGRAVSGAVAGLAVATTTSGPDRPGCAVPSWHGPDCPTPSWHSPRTPWRSWARRCSCAGPDDAAPDGSAVRRRRAAPVGP